MYLVILGYVITEDGNLIPINSDEYKKLKTKLQGQNNAND